MSYYPRKIEKFDEYGFAVFAPSDSAPPDTERCHEYTAPALTAEQESLWDTAMKDWVEDDAQLTQEQMALVEGGVPARYRSRLWTRLLEVDSLKQCNSFHYKEELARVREQLVELGISEFSCGASVARLCEVEEELGAARNAAAKPSSTGPTGPVSLAALRHILLDLERTFPTHAQFVARDGAGVETRASLFRVLAVYARYNRAVEYCQGMSAVAGMLVMQLESEDDSFWCLVSLLERHKYLVGYFSQDMVRLRKHAEVFDKLLFQKHRKVQQHLARLCVGPLMYVPPWLLCVFTSLACWDTVIAIWDHFLLHGYKTLFRVGLALISVLEADLLACHGLSELLPLLLRIPPSVVRHCVLLPRLHCTPLDDRDLQRHLAAVDEEERAALDPLHKPQREHRVTTRARATRSGLRSRLGLAAPPPVPTESNTQLRGQKRKGSVTESGSVSGASGSPFGSSSAGAWLFRFTDVPLDQPSKRVRLDNTEDIIKPSFLSRIRGVFGSRRQPAKLPTQEKHCKSSPVCRKNTARPQVMNFANCSTTVDLKRSRRRSSGVAVSKQSQDSPTTLRSRDVNKSPTVSTQVHRSSPLADVTGRLNVARSPWHEDSFAAKFGALLTFDIGRNAKNLDSPCTETRATQKKTHNCVGVQNQFQPSKDCGPILKDSPFREEADVSPFSHAIAKAKVRRKTPRPDTPTRRSPQLSMTRDNSRENA